MTLDEVLSRFDGVKRSNGSQFMARCPCHDDRSQSLSIGAGQKGVVIKCHAGCDTHDIIAAVGLKARDLFYEERPTKPQERPKPKFEREHIYPGGKVKKAVFRFPDGSKTMSWRHLEGSKWEKGRGNNPHQLYIPGSIDTTMVIVEGEKDADTLSRMGWPVASGENGAGPGKWLPEYTEQLKDCSSICIFPDNDRVGKEYAQETAAALSAVCQNVTIADLTTVWPEIPEHGDISDLLAHVGEEEAQTVVVTLIGSATPYKPDKQKQTGPSLISASEVIYEPPRWTLEPYFQQGKGTLIQGDNGSGKTAFMMAIAAHVSTGTPLLGLSVADPGPVLILSVEDDLPILRGRIEANGGDLSKCYFLTNTAGLTFNSPIVEESIKQVNAKMVIFDPFQAFLGANVDMWRGNETRPELAKLFDMCDRNNCSCAIIAHMAKTGGDKSPVNRSLGSVDIPAAMRSILQLTNNPDDPDEKVAVHIKCSNAPKGQSIAYIIGDRGGVHWTGFSPMTVEDLATIQKRKEKGVSYDHEPLVQVFNQLITDRPGGGFWSYSDLSSEGAKILGFPPYSSVPELRQRLDGGLARELQKRDGLIVTHSVKGSHNIRGIKIEQYKAPGSYQLKLV